MDAVPASRFYSARWDRYGSDPVPPGRTSDFGFRDAYGLDAIPDAVIPEVHDRIRQVFPHQLLEVLTGAREGEADAAPCDMTPRGAPGH
jgi:hypothetical protein